jgi:hypothetical protein
MERGERRKEKRKVYRETIIITPRETVVSLLMFGLPKPFLYIDTGFGFVQK